MKNVFFLVVLLMAFVSFASMTDSFADSSPPGVDISIDYELPLNIDLLNAGNVESGEVRIAVFDCDLNMWPVHSQTVSNKANHFKFHYSFMPLCYVNISGKGYGHLTLLDQFIRPVDKHGIADREAGYTQSLYSYLC